MRHATLDMEKEDAHKQSLKVPHARRKQIIRDKRPEQLNLTVMASRRPK